MGTLVDFYDPYIREYKYKGKVYEGLTNIDEEAIEQYDLVVVTTAHTVVNYEIIAENASAIFDTKNAMKDVRKREKIELL